VPAAGIAADSPQYAMLVKSRRERATNGSYFAGVLLQHCVRGLRAESP